jgi:uroporphyrinogen decarboxylase
MDSRTRVMTSLDHKEPDRVPIDFGGLTTSIQVDGYKKLLDYLDIEVSEIIIADQFQNIVYPDQRLLDMFHTDVLGVYTNAGTGWELKIDPATDSWVDEWGFTYRRPPGGYWYDIVGNPLKEGTLEELKKYKWPDPDDPNRVKGLKEKVKDLYKNTDKAIIKWAGKGGIFEQATWLRGIENLFMDMAFNLKYIDILSEKILEYDLAWWNNILEAVKGYVQVVQIGDDLGSMDGPLFSPEIYRKIYKPRHKKLIESIKDKAPGVKVYLHSCGSIYEYIPDIIEIGVDIINPVQISARNMGSEKLKKEFGSDIAFWGGGADASNAMAFYTPEKLKEEVKRRIDDFAPGGGFVFGSVHNIQAGVPPENIIAFFEAAYEYGKY